MFGVININSIYIGSKGYLLMLLFILRKSIKDYLVYIVWLKSIKKIKRKYL